MKRPLYNILLSILLIVCVLVNFASYSGVGNIVSNYIKPTSSSIENKPPYIPSEPEYPTIPAAVLLFSGNPAISGAVATKTELSVSQVGGFNVSFSADKNVGLKSYMVSGGIEVKFDTSVDRYMVSDAISVDDKIAVEKLYYQTDDNKQLNLDEIYADYYSVEIDYTDSGKVAGLYYTDSYYIFEYDSNDKLTAIYRDTKLWKSFSYNAQNKIVSETLIGDKCNFIRNYSYTESGKLFSIDSKLIPNIVKNGQTITIDGYNFGLSADNSIITLSGDASAKFSYDYTFNAQKYLTTKTVNGITTNYSYLGDKVIGINRGSNAVYYILDNDLNYVGLKYNGTKYYFAVDPFGNVMGLMDCDGNFVVEYSYDIWGNVVEVYGTLSNSLGKLNEITNLNGIYDFTLNAYFMGEDLYMPSYGVVVSPNVENNISDAVSTYEWSQDSYFSRSAVTDFAKIHDKVVSVAIENLQEAGLDVTGNLYATDVNGNAKRLVDIYTIDYSITPFSAMNLIDGNQIYEVIYHAPDSMAFESLAEKKLKTIAQELAVSYFGDYDATVGTMKFNGQFVYLGYLIDYKCTGNGIVEYQVKINKKSNYNQSVNIYDYDTGKYICYVNNTFDLNFLDGVTIIPGISKETFDVIDEYLGDYLQSVSGDICDQMLIYNDPSYYNTVDMNLRPDYWSQVNLPDTTTYLEMQVDGSVKVSTMPAWETDGFQTKLLIGSGVILVTAVVATVAIMIPGANCVVVSICVGAANGAAGGAVSGFAFGAVAGATGEFIGQVSSGKDIDWNAIGNKALNAAADGFASGAITGAIMGGISGGLNPKYCFAAGTPVLTQNGFVSVENIAVGDMVWSYDYQSGEKSLKEVTNTSVRQTNDIIQIKIGGQAITTTPEHPFYVVNDNNFYGYTAAKYLTVDDCIQTSGGGYQVIEAIEQCTLDEPIYVYNFTVEDNHSYYVGDSEVLVHNANCNEVPDLKYSQRKLQHEFKHAKDFGIDGNWNSQNGSKFLEKIIDHIDDPSTISKISTYRGKQIVVHYNSNTGNGVYLDLATNTLEAAWKLSPQQILFHGF